MKLTSRLSRSRSPLAICADILIGLAALAYLSTFVSNRILHRAPSPETAMVGVDVGDVSVDWAGAKTTVVLVLTQSCPFCVRSAPFYKKLIPEVKKRSGLQLAALFPHAARDGEVYLHGLGLDVAIVRGSVILPWGVQT